MLHSKSLQVRRIIKSYWPQIPIPHPPVQVWSCAIGPSRSGSHRLRPLTATIVFCMCNEWLQYLCVWCKTFPLASIHYRSKIPRSLFFCENSSHGAPWTPASWLSSRAAVHLVCREQNCEALHFQWIGCIPAAIGAAMAPLL